MTKAMTYEILCQSVPKAYLDAREQTSNGLAGLSGGEALDSESLHKLSVGLAVARNHQDRIGNPSSCHPLPARRKP